MISPSFLIEKMKTKILLTCIAIVMACGNLQAQQDTEPSSQTPDALNFTMQTLAGKDVELSKYQGKVVVFVNVASKCGYTPQYKPLQALHAEYAEQGLAIVGVPCNQFGGQEPGSSEDILSFCQENYGVEFDMLAKVDVKGENTCDLYKHLTGLDLQPKGSGVVRWNFEKIVLDRAGNPIARFGTKVDPSSEAFTKVIKEALAATVDSGSDQK